MERHGHIIATGSGLRARCGGRALCQVCKAEFDDVVLRLAMAANVDTGSALAMQAEGFA